MSRPFTSTKPKKSNGQAGLPGERPSPIPGPGPEWASLGGGAPAEAELVDRPMNVLPERYESRPARPFAQMALRAGLWLAVGLGCVGGIVGLVRPTEVPETSGVDAEAVSTIAGVPGPVSGMAELVAREWLLVTPESQARVEALFVEIPALDPPDEPGVRVGPVTAVSGRRLQEQYWAVTVAVEVTEDVPRADGDDPARGEDPGAVTRPEDLEAHTSTWFLDVAIVGDPQSGLLALTAPAVLPTAPPAATGWRPSVSGPEEPKPDDPTAATIEGFFDALLAGDGDPARYTAPRVELTPANPPLFVDTAVVDLAIDEMTTGEFRVLARISATTEGGSTQLFSYELVVVERVDRLEVTEFSGAPSRIAGSPAPEVSDDEAPAADEEAPQDQPEEPSAAETTTTTPDGS